MAGHIETDNSDVQLSMKKMTSRGGDESGKSRVTVVGSGNWGSVAAKLIGSNTLKLDSFHGTQKKC